MPPAVEPDNIDSYDRSKGQLTKAEAVAYLTLLAPHAHTAGLAIAQKNTTELGTAGKNAGLDFATLSIVRRDVDVTAPGSGIYVYNAC